MTIAEDGTLGGPVAKNISDSERAGLAEAMDAKPVMRSSSGPAPGNRPRIARCSPGGDSSPHRIIDENEWSFVWIVDAPMFKSAEDAVAAGDVAVGGGKWTAVHHAFTSPKPEHMDSFDTDPGSALSYGYDFVCNGNEIGGGSIRITAGTFRSGSST